MSFLKFFQQLNERVQPGLNNNLIGVSHRHQHPVVRDPGTRKNAETVPNYLQTDSSLPAAYKLLQQRVGPKYVKISAKDAYMLTKRFGVNRLKPGKPKGLKKSGIAIEIKPNGQYYLLKTKKEQPQEPTEIQNNGA